MISEDVEMQNRAQKMKRASLGFIQHHIYWRIAETAEAKAEADFYIFNNNGRTK